MNAKHELFPSMKRRGKSCPLDRRLAAYLGAAAAGTFSAAEAEAVVVSNSAVQPFGINEEVNIDFNSDGQTDFQIDHDRVDLGGGNFVDFLQIDKNDQTGASPGEDPLAIPAWEIGFPTNGAPANDTAEAAHVVPAPSASNEVNYPSALLAGQEIGAAVSSFDFQESSDVYSSGLIARANRLIDEDHNRVDTVLGGHQPADFYPIANTPQFVGLGGEVRYLGVKMDLQDTDAINYGWIGVHITNEEDATGEVVGWGYETEPGVSILAGATAPGLAGDHNGDGTVDAADYVVWRKNPTAFGGDQGYTDWRTNFGDTSAAAAVAGTGGQLHAVPEPHSALLAFGTGFALLGAFVLRRFRRS